MTDANAVTVTVTLTVADAVALTEALTDHALPDIDNDLSKLARIVEHGMEPEMKDALARVQDLRRVLVQQVLHQLPQPSKNGS